MRLLKGGIFTACFVLASFACRDWESLSRDYSGSRACVAYVVLGDTHTCARRTDGTLSCWGDNRFGQLGTGDTRNVVGSSDVGFVGDQAGAQVAKVYLPAGNGEISSDRAVYTCALSTASELLCWGDNRLVNLAKGIFVRGSTRRP